jgi:uncharacterized membrane protein YdcZ (DUF606 family)
MIFLFIIPFFLGVLGVVQTQLNRHIAGNYSFREAIFMNGFFVFASASIFLILGYLSKPTGDGEQPLRILKEFKLYYCLPGLFGFVLVLGFPWATAQFGAVRVFVAAVAGQLLMSLLFDWVQSELKPDWTRVVGVGLALLGALVANIKALKA